MVDFATATISALALAVSIVSAIYSFRLQRFESRRTTREHLNGTINELIKLIAEYSSALFVAQEARDYLYYQKVGTITHTATALSRQAVYLAEQQPDLVADVEYATIAQGLVLAGDSMLAGRFWQKAIESSTGEYYTIVNTRSYADYLFNQGRHEAGREHYQKALSIFGNEGDFQKFTNAYTHQMWMVSEANHRIWEEAEKHHNLARRIFESVASPSYRETGLAGLQRAYDMVFSAFSTRPAVAANPALTQGT